MGKLFKEFLLFIRKTLLKLVCFNLIPLLYRHLHGSAYKKSGRKGLKLQFFGRILKIYLKINVFCQKIPVLGLLSHFFCSWSRLHVYTKVILSYSQLCWSPLDFVLSMFDDFWQLLIFKFWKRRHAHCPTKPWKFYLLFVVWFEKSGKIWKFYLAKYDQTERIHAI